MIGPALRAFGHGLWTAARAPLLLAGITVVLAAAALPFGLVVHSQVQASLAGQPPLEAWQGDIDPEWWAEFRTQARGLSATFTPAIIGAAAPLDTLSAVVDGTTQPWAMAAPVVVSLLIWSWLWGGVLDRFHRGEAAGPRAFAAAGFRWAPRFIVISAAATAVVLLLYVTVHPLLFGPVYSGLAAQAGSERAAFAWRVVLYGIFGVLLALVGLVADYARIALVARSAGSSRGALWVGVQFVREHLLGNLTLWGVALAVNGAFLAAYVAVDVYGGSRVGGWRAIAIGQAYLVSRLVMRVTVAAAEVRLFLR